MKRKLSYLGMIMILVAAAEAAFSYFFGSAWDKRSGSGQSGTEEFASEKEADILVMTSFYPIYIIACNLTMNIPEIVVHNLTPNQTGCLHDYQLTTGDMKRLEQADVLLLNGGGMETFLETVAANLPKLLLVYSDTDIELLSEAENHHSHSFHASYGGETESESDGQEKEGSGHGELNAHMWMSPECYGQQIRNLAAGLIELDPAHRLLYEKNRDSYLEKVQQVQKEYEDFGQQMALHLDNGSEPVVIFHEAFAYLAETLPIEVVHAMELEGEELALSAGEMAEVVEEIRLHQIRYLFVEEQYRQTVATQIAAETGTKTIVLNPLVSGEENFDAWLIGMKENLEHLQEIFRGWKNET